MKKKNYNWIAHVFVLTATIYLCTHIIPLINGKTQHDFRTYYYATIAYYQGMDPYELKSLRDVSDINQIKLPFTYPPHCFTIFKPITLLNYIPAYYVFLAIKLMAIIALIFIWTRIVPTDRRGWWVLYVTIILGYRSAIYRDLNAGNISIFEQLIVWTGVLFLIRDKTLIGGISIALSSIFKLITIALLPLIIVVRQTWHSVCLTFFLAAISLCTYILLYSANPQMWIKFIDIIKALGGRGNTCPSSWALLHDIAAVTFISNTSVYLIYGLLCFVVLTLLTWSFIVRRTSKDKYPLLYLTIIAYVILAPRMKDYSLIIALLPTLHSISSMTLHRWQIFVGVILLWIPIIDYQPLLTATFTFYLIINWIWKNRNDPSTKIKLTLNPFEKFNLGNARSNR